MLEPIGFITLFAGIICLSIGHRAAAATLIVSTLLGSAAALLVGAATIQPAHFFLIFVAITALSRRHEARSAIQSLTPPAPGFWLLCMVIYGILGGFLFPRLFAGITYIFPVGTSQYELTNSAVPLGPTSGNTTQSIYLIADLICFSLMFSVASSIRGFDVVTRAIICYAFANILFAALDVFTYATGTQGILDFIRNAQYALHLEEQVGDIKRIAGSFTESSAFAQATLGALGFTGTLWLCEYRPAWTGLLAVISLILLVISTSSTGLAGIPPLIVILYITAIRKCSTRPGGRLSAAAVIIGPLAIITISLAVFMSDEASYAISQYLDQLIFNKSQTESGIERGTWNTAAILNFTETWGLGVGLGTNRASSFILALLSNVGLPGTLLYIFFIISVFSPSRVMPNDYFGHVRLSARNACFGLLIAHCISGALVDQGLIFYVYAALATSFPDRSKNNQFEVV